MKRYSQLELSICVNGQTETKYVAKINIGNTLDSLLASSFESPKEYTCDWWALYTIDRCYFRTKNDKATSQKYQYCVASASDGSLPSNGFLEDCFTTGPFWGHYIAEA